MRRLICCLALASSVVAARAQPRTGVATFVDLAPPGAATSGAYGISRDGQAVIGSVTGPGPQHRAGLWSADGSFADLGIPAGFSECYGMAAAEQGEAAVLLAVGPTGERAFLWTQASGIAPWLAISGSMSTVARDISPDARFIAGDIQSGATRAAVRWSAGPSVVVLPDLPAGEFISYAMGISPSGDTIVGSGTDASTIPKACRWRFDGPGLGPTVRQLPGFPGAPAWLYSIARAVTPDGRIAVGEATHAPGVVEACLWTSADQIVGLGSLRPGDETYAHGVSLRALRVVGESYTTAQSLATLWTPQRGVQSLQKVLEDDYGLDLGPWTLEIAFGVSDDGRRIAGTGFRHGVRQAWLATLPAPCYADCNADGALTVADIACFQTFYLTGAFYADCTGDGALTVSDLGCFQNEFIAGCP